MIFTDEHGDKVELYEAQDGSLVDEWEVDDSDDRLTALEEWAAWQADPYGHRRARPLGACSP